MDNIKAFHLDCGRKYFTAGQIINILKAMGENGYNTLELAFGNGGMRFLLDDMSVDTGTDKYDSETVRDAVMEGNRKYCDLGANALTEAEMEDIIRVAGACGIRIMPLLNTPGHMDAIVTALEIMGFGNVRYKASATTMDLDNVKAVAFVKELVRKYAKWFADHNSQLFNLGSDEYANDVLKSGFASLQAADNFKYDRFISYVNELSMTVKEYGLTPVMFNDGMYYDRVTGGGMLDKDIICSYWSEGWPGYNPAPVRFVIECGHRILNTSCSWYYVLGRRRGSKIPDFNCEAAEKGIKENGYDNVVGYHYPETAGAMICLWCDEPDAEYNDEEENIVTNLIKLF